MLYNATGREEFRDSARKVTDAYLRRLSSQRMYNAAQSSGSAVGAAGAGAGAEYDGYMPHWDFDAPWVDELDGPRDTSAAAVAALGMLYLADAEARWQQQQQQQGGVAGAGGDGGMVGNGAAVVGGNGSSMSGGGSCASKYLCAAVGTLRALASPKYLAAGDVSFPALLKHATGGYPLGNHIDVGLITGDYYYLEALNKCAGMEACVRLGSGGGGSGAARRRRARF